MYHHGMTKPPPTPTRTSPKFDLRLPDDMRERVAIASKRDGRSMNSQVVAYVAAGLDNADALMDAIQRVEKKLDSLIESIEGRK